SRSSFSSLSSTCNLHPVILSSPHLASLSGGAEVRKFILGYLIPRIGQYFMVIFLGVTLTFIIPRLSPNDPVEQQIGQMMMSGSHVSPEAIEHLREALTEMYGLSGSPWQQY